MLVHRGNHYGHTRRLTSQAYINELYFSKLKLYQDLPSLSPVTYHSNQSITCPISSPNKPTISPGTRFPVHRYISSITMDHIVLRSAFTIVTFSLEQVLMSLS